MINVRIIRRAKSQTGTGAGTAYSGGTAVIAGTVDEAKHAYEADRAGSAEYADKSGYADTAGTATRAHTADNLADDFEYPDRWIRNDESDTASGDLYTFEHDVTVEENTVHGGTTTHNGQTTHNADVNINADADIEGTLYTDRIGSHTTDGSVEMMAGLLTDYVRSKNGADLEELFGEGFLMKADSENKAHIFTDYLTVRLKAYFTELEIRRLSYVGGSIVLTPAGSKIAFVKWLDDNGDELERTDENISSVKSFKVYNLADDGTIATQNAWQVGDQARCQTFNVDGAGKYQDVANTYYWRLVTSAGQERVRKDFSTVNPSDSDYATADVASYIILSNEQYVSIGGVQYVGYDTSTGNDFPNVDDTLVGMGNQVTPSERGNIIMLRTVSEGAETAPSITMYRSVGTRAGSAFPYSLNGRDMFSVSPSGFTVLTRYFLLKDSSSDEGHNIAQYRGDWNAIAVYNYGDTVTYGGAMWQCKLGNTDVTPIEGAYWHKVDITAEDTAVWSIECNVGAIAIDDTKVTKDVILGFGYSSTDYMVGFNTNDVLKIGESTEAGGTAVVTARVARTTGSTREYPVAGTLKAECISEGDVIRTIGTSQTGMLSFGYSDIDTAADYVRISLLIGTDVVATYDIPLIPESMTTDKMFDEGSYARLSLVADDNPQTETRTVTASLDVNIMMSIRKQTGNYLETLQDTTGYSMSIYYYVNGQDILVGVDGDEDTPVLVYNRSFTGLNSNALQRTASMVMIALISPEGKEVDRISLEITQSTGHMFYVGENALQSWYFNDTHRSMIEQSADQIQMMVQGLGAEDDGHGHYSSFDMTDSQITVDTKNFLIKYGSDSYLLFGDDGTIRSDFISITADRIDFTGFTSINGMTVDLNGNLTVDGVINNNLMVVATLASEGVRACLDVFSGIYNGEYLPTNLWLDPLRLGRMVWLTSDFNGATINLPWAEWDSAEALVYGYTGSDTQDEQNRRPITLDELRKSVGKIFTLLNADEGSTHYVQFQCGYYDSGNNPIGWIVKEDEMYNDAGTWRTDFSNLTMNANWEIKKVLRREIAVPIYAGHWLELEFCMGEKEGREFFYWKARYYDTWMLN